jgi:hypothetical protein
MAARMSDKFDKYWGDMNMLMALAAVLDPIYKMKLISFCFLSFIHLMLKVII